MFEITTGRCHPQTRRGPQPRRFALPGVAVVVGVCLATLGMPRSTTADESSPAAAKTTAATAATTARWEADVIRVADEIDRLVGERWAKDAVQPVAPADDAEFYRRISLDLIGRIPSGTETRMFLADTTPDKRRRAITELMESAAYITHLTNVWRRALIPEAESDQQVRVMVPLFEVWLRKRLSHDTSYTSLVRELLTAPLEPLRNGQMMMYAETATGSPEDQGPLAFYRAKQLKAENLAAATSRVFLGLRIECAQCHDHPFDTWKQDQFWKYAAFFSGLRTQGDNDNVMFASESFEKPRVTIPGLEKTVDASFLDGAQPQWSPQSKPRQTLASWITDNQNPYFTRAAVNRIWGQMIGIGLVEPVDDFTADNPASHPELLDMLAKEFQAHDHDVKFIVRAILYSKCYQLSSRQESGEPAPPRLFARTTVRSLSPEQLFDSLAQATGFYEPRRNENLFAIDDQTPRTEFLSLFALGTESVVDKPSTILQALGMMNGQFIANATDLERSTTLAGVLMLPGATVDEQVEALFLATLSRMPTREERETFVGYTNAAAEGEARSKALADVFWALLNSSEFSTNH